MVGVGLFIVTCSSAFVVLLPCLCLCVYTYWTIGEACVYEESSSFICDPEINPLHTEMGADGRCYRSGTYPSGCYDTEEQTVLVSVLLHGIVVFDGMFFFFFVFCVGILGLVSIMVVSVLAPAQLRLLPSFHSRLCFFHDCSQVKLSFVKHPPL